MFFDSADKKEASIKRCFTTRFGVKPLRESRPAVGQWFQSTLGKNILSLEQQKLDALMPEIFGYHLMQLSVLPNIDLSRQSPVTHHFSLSVDHSDSDLSHKESNSEKDNEVTVKNNFPIQPSAVSQFESLPIDEESIDAAILHHVLDYSVDPHRLLREVSRTIIANGYIVVVGFNPSSPFMLKKQVGRYIKKSDHWRYHDLRKDRVIDWLRVLGFKPMLVQYGYHNLPFNKPYSEKLDKIIAQLLPFLGAFYIIVARKHVVPMTLIRKPWKRRRALPAWVKGKAVQHSEITSEKNKHNINES